MARKKRVPVYVDETEYEIINQAAHHARLSMSAWCRKTLIEIAQSYSPPPPPKLSPTTPTIDTDNPFAHDAIIFD